jgi:hypothetical protein
MIDSANVPEVAAEESLARYVLQSSHVRRSNKTVKPDAFMPHPHVDLSVTRHRMATEAELWSVGVGVATVTGKILYGRGDIQAHVCLVQKLSVRADPVEGNPNHASVTSWPADKPLQKAIAQEVAATARFVEHPRGSLDA